MNFAAFNKELNGNIKGNIIDYGPLRNGKIISRTSMVSDKMYFFKSSLDYFAIGITSHIRDNQHGPDNFCVKFGYKCSEENQFGRKAPIRTICVFHKLFNQYAFTIHSRFQMGEVEYFDISRLEGKQGYLGIGFHQKENITEIFFQIKILDDPRNPVYTYRYDILFSKMQFYLMFESFTPQNVPRIFNIVKYCSCLYSSPSLLALAYGFIRSNLEMYNFYRNCMLFDYSLDSSETNIIVQEYHSQLVRAFEDGEKAIINGKYDEDERDCKYFVKSSGVSFPWFDIILIVR